ncbi:hypothetical protein PHYSODRAFT_339268 [Phytophthora sojae]|uniref:RxLR effector protein n=1 Tax=Phytophthora sojae (strain P6497) TaxID=1094619 RepID=G5A685_PHYSP|nr:hypothetical protein PHYSODRAFT_339268 [Phytophthora sojae]EGZ08840.1 hypothetical protein PHYSODRAFT_339268 [Phytophthora sojae]|eukprot:XP_009535473.1 hypothetical protein PHYSODRAFT_339268 [Phytophthora sojae]
MRVAHAILLSVAAFCISCGGAFGADPTSLASHSQSEKKLDKMLKSEEIAERNFLRWNSAIKKDGKMAAKIEQAIIAEGKHYGTLLTQFHIHNERN